MKFEINGLVAILTARCASGPTGRDINFPKARADVQ